MQVGTKPKFHLRSSPASYYEQVTEDNNPDLVAAMSKYATDWHKSAMPATDTASATSPPTAAAPATDIILAKALYSDLGTTLVLRDCATCGPGECCLANDESTEVNVSHAVHA